MDITQHGYVRTAITPEGIATIVFFHPNHNSLPSRLLADLTEHIQAAGQMPAVKVIVLRSAEHKTFCAGASFDELAAIQDFATAQSFFNGFGQVINGMRTCPKIIVGRIHGKAVGGGCHLRCPFAHVKSSATHCCGARKSRATRPPRNHESLSARPEFRPL